MNRNLRFAALAALALGVSGCVVAAVSEKMDSVSRAYTEAKVVAGRGDYALAVKRIGEIEASFKAPLLADHIDAQRYRDLHAGLLEELVSLRRALEVEDRQLVKEHFRSTFKACEACHQVY